VTKIDRYVLKELLPPFFFGLVVYIFLLLVSNLLGQAKWVVGFPLWGILKWLWYQIPLVLNQTLPVALMLAVLLAFGRLSRENELLAMQAGGIPLLRVTRWAFVLAILATAYSLYQAEYVIPKANARVTQVWWDELRTQGRGLSKLVGQDVAVGPYRLFFSGYDYRAGEMVGVRLERWQDEAMTVVLAERGRMKDNRLTLWNYRVYGLDLAALDREADAESTLRGLLRSRSAGERLVLKLPKTREDLIARNAGELWGDTHSISYWAQRAFAKDAGPKDRAEALVMMHANLALPFANLVVVIFALPLAVRKATSTSLAFGYTLLVTILYYFLMTAGKILAFGGKIDPVLAAWGPNLIFLVIGLWLLRGLSR